MSATLWRGRTIILSVLALSTQFMAVGRTAAQEEGVSSSLWPTTAAPQHAVFGDSQSVELGVRFQSNTPGQVLGVRVYRGQRDTEELQVSLWTADGQLVARATIPPGTQTGWRSVPFTSPVDLAAGTTYVASYFAPMGGYAATNDYFRTDHVADPLIAPAGNNGVYRYGASGFPDQTYRATNYWVDVLFQPSGGTPATLPPATLPPATSSPASTPNTTRPPPAPPSPTPTTGPTFYVSPTGDDSYPGTVGRPWRTIRASASRLRPGDTLVVRGGVYPEANISINVSATADRPVTIKAQPGEIPIIDGALDRFEVIGQQAWVLVDEARNIWRSAHQVPTAGPYGYTGRIEVDGELYALTSYRDNQLGTALDFLSASRDLYTDSRPYYMGPGITYRPDGHLYIRLDPNSSEAQWNRRAPFVIADRDPNHHPVFVAPTSIGLLVHGSHVVIDGINLRHHWQTLGGSGTNVTIKNLTLRPGRFGVRVDGDRWLIDHVTIDHDRPPWLARSDVKGAQEPAGYSRTTAVSWEAADYGQLRSSRLLGSFDCMLALGDNRGLRIVGNLLDQCMDDGMQLSVGVHDLEFAHNLVTGAGPSHDKTGSGDSPDSVYIHHNVFDNTSRTFWARKPEPGKFPAEQGWRGYECAPIFSSHGQSQYRDPWKIYNNTFQACTAPGQQGINHYLAGGSAGQGVNEAYNNIINIGNSDYLYRWVDATTGYEIYDGNIYGRTKPLWPFGLEVVATDGPHLQIQTFAEWQATMAASSRAYYPPGWDAHSRELDSPLPLDAEYRPARNGPAATGAVNLAGKGWPGTAYAPWIGARRP